MRRSQVWTCTMSTLSWGIWLFRKLPPCHSRLESGFWVWQNDKYSPRSTLQINYSYMIRAELAYLCLVFAKQSRTGPPPGILKLPWSVRAPRPLDSPVVYHSGYELDTMLLLPAINICLIGWPPSAKKSVSNRGFVCIVCIRRDIEHGASTCVAGGRPRFSCATAPW